MANKFVAAWVVPNLLIQFHRPPANIRLLKMLALSFEQMTKAIQSSAERGESTKTPESSSCTIHMFNAFNDSGVKGALSRYSVIFSPFCCGEK